MCAIRFTFIALVTTLALLPASAQVRHVTTVRPATGQSTEMEVYEFDYVDVQPQFPGGEHGLINYINRTRVYPYEAYQKRIQGRVLCSFIVGTDGRVNREAIRVISEMPRWSAGKMGHSAVPVRCVLPIAFRL